MPSFAIEVPGEAAPLSESLLVHTLQAASSSNPTQIQTGTKQLQRWEKTAGYYRYLQNAYLDHNLPLELRYLAILQLKHGIDRYWRKTATNAVSKDDKEAIRARLVQGLLNEGENRLALQNALVVAKIARFEYPNDWPEAISAFVEAVRSPSSSPSQLSRALLALLYIVKDLSVGRLQRTRQLLQTATPEVISVVGNVYVQTVQRWTSTLNVDDMQQSLLAIKLLRRLLISGYENPNRNSDVASFWSLTLDHWSSFIQLMKAQGTSSLSSEAARLLGRHALQLSKLHLEMARNHPAAYVLLPNSIELSRSYWNFVKDFGDVFSSKAAVVAALSSGNIDDDGDVDERSFAEKIALKGLLILRALVKMLHSSAHTFKYRQPEDKEEKNLAMKIVGQDLLIEPFVRDLIEHIVTRFFVLRTSDIRDWLTDPQEWEVREEGGGEDWEFSIRSCSEKLFLDIAINYKDIVVRPLLEVFASVANLDNEDVLFKDSVYTAIGLSAAVIYKQLDFGAFIQNVLVAEVQKKNPGCNILRRRIAILLGQWCPVEVPESSNFLIYQIFQHLLNPEDPSNDLVVRVTAGRQLHEVANDWLFDADQFLPYAHGVLTHMMQLIEEVDLAEIKMALLITISTLVKRLEHKVLPFAGRIVELLPPLWAQSEQEHLMKQAILGILESLVTAIRADSLPLHPVILPIIKGTVEPGSEALTYLLEDALELWGAVLTQTPSGSASQDLLSLVQYLYPIYELASENLRKALELTQSYTLLAPSYMLSDQIRPWLFTALERLLGRLKAEANGLVCEIVNLAIQCAQRLGDESAVTQVASDLTRAGFLPGLMRDLHGCWAARSKTGPLAEDPPVSAMVETDYLVLLARLILGSVEGFFQVAHSCASPGQDLEGAMAWLLEEWFRHFENVGDPSRRKLMCLALTRLLQTRQPFILVNLQSLMTVWTDVVVELREGAEDTGDSLLWKGEGEAPKDEFQEQESAEDARWRELSRADVVHTVNLPKFIQHHLQQAVGGDEQQFQQQWLVNVDKDVVKAFSDLGIM